MANKENKRTNENKTNVPKKQFYKKIWFWLFVIWIAFSVFKNDDMKTKINGVTFKVSDVKNDVTNKYHICLISDNIQPEDYALEYYQNVFKNDKEIHAIINQNYKTTTEISVAYDCLSVITYEYVDGEEKDVNKLFSGTLLDALLIDMDTGDIVNVKEISDLWNYTY